MAHSRDSSLPLIGRISTCTFRSNSFDFRDIFIAHPIYAFGAEYSRQSIVGPLRVAVQWCNITGFTAYASIGFNF